MFLASILSLSSKTLQIQLWGWPVIEIIAFVGLPISIISLLISLRSSYSANKAAVLATLPVLRIGRQRDQSLDTIFDDILVLSNVGKGIAYDIQIDRAFTYVRDTFFGVELDAIWGMQILAGARELLPQETRVLKVEGMENGKAISSGQLQLGVSLVGDKILKLPIRFHDVTGRQYITVIGLGKGDAWVITPSRSYNLWRRARYTLKYRLATGVLYVTAKLKMNARRRKTARKTKAGDGSN